MKKFLVLAVVILAMFSTHAQRATVIPLAAGDTVVNTGTANKVITLTAGYSGVAIQPILTKVSGTVAGTVILYKSLDGTNYVSAGDTITNANQTTNTAVWQKTSPVPVYYKVLATGSGTMSAILTVKYVARRHD